MKTVIVIAKYEAYVPDDMSISEFQELAEKEINNNLDSFSIDVPYTSGEDETFPVFELRDVMCGTRCMIAVGDDTNNSTDHTDTPQEKYNKG